MPTLTAIISDRGVMTPLIDPVSKIRCNCPDFKPNLLDLYEYCSKANISYLLVADYLSCSHRIAFRHFGPHLPSIYSPLSRVLLWGICPARWYPGYHRFVTRAEVLFRLVGVISVRNRGYRCGCIVLHPSWKCCSLDLLPCRYMAHHFWHHWDTLRVLT